MTLPFMEDVVQKFNLDLLDLKIKQRVDINKVNIKCTEDSLRQQNWQSTTKVDCTVPYLSDLQDLYTSSIERFDVVVYNEMDGGNTKVVQVVHHQ